VLDELHEEGHLGIVKMKALGRSYMWWPSIDQSIEAMAKTCSGCQLIQNNPKNAPLHPWEWSWDVDTLMLIQNGRMWSP
jgi:hypothetical protein